MKKTQNILLLACLIFLLQGCASTGRVDKLSTHEDISSDKAISDISTKNRFHTGKRLTYLIAWNGIPVGNIITETRDIKKYRGRDVHVVKLVTESNKFLSKIYRVEDTYISYVDAETITSRRYEADRKEGNYRKHVIVEYDFDKMQAEYTNLTDGSVKKCDITENVQDPLSAMCYFMTLPVEIGKKVHITVNLNEKNYDLYARVEAIDVVELRHLGKFPAFKVRPYAQLKGQRVKKGRAWMYFSADKNRYPLYGVVRIPFGRVTATLRSIEDIRSDV
ncbi:MAG: DUF3108 domain-containing protein [Candidatus Omnitrophica bacterium]|nr:DUF3108 domain-containing protein [Candidatus Omnitrophota bacterium]